jgi:SNF2 family DNA or RNA helicase
MSTTGPSHAVRRQRRGITPRQVLAIGIKKQNPISHWAAASFKRRILGHRRMLFKKHAGAGGWQQLDPADELFTADADTQEDLNNVELIAADSTRPIATLSVEQLRYAYLKDPSAFLEAKINPVLLDPTLWKKQDEAIEHFIKRESHEFYGSLGAIGCLYQGAGKTLIVCEFIRRAAVKRVAAEGRSRFGFPTLVVVTHTTILQWRDQLKTFFTPEMLSYALAYGTAEHGATAAALEVSVDRIMHCLDLVVTTYETLMYGLKGGEPRGLFAVKWERIVADEGGDNIANVRTGRFAACAAIVTPRRLYITAEPIPNSRLSELNSALAFIGCTKLLPEAEDRRQAIDDGAMPQLDELVLVQSISPLAGLAPETLALRDELLRELLFIVTRETPLPEICWVEFNAMERMLYDRELFAQQERRRNPSTTTEEDQARNKLADYVTLRKLCLDPILVQTPTEILALGPNRLPSSKIAAVLTYIETQMAPGEKALCFCEWLRPLVEVAHHLSLRGITHEIMRSKTSLEQRRAMVTRVGDHASPHPRVLLMPYRIGAVGLDGLQGTHRGGGANHVLLLAGHWHSSMERQARFRVDRIGQTKAVRVVKFVVRNTFDEQVLLVNLTKEARGREILTLRT